MTTTSNSPLTASRARVVGPGQSLMTSLAGLVLLGVTVVVALMTTAGQRVDDRAMNTVVAGREAQLSVLSVLGYVSIGAIAAVTVACVAVAALRGHWRLAVAALLVITGANITTQILKHQALERQDLGFGVLNSLPSGHTTLVASGVAALALVVPRAVVPLLAFAGAFAVTMTGASTVVAGWHRPSDVIAAVAVTLVWTGAADLMFGTRTPAARGTIVGALAGAGAAGVTLIVIGVRPLQGWAGFFDAGAVLGVTALAVAVWAWLTTRLGG